MPTTNLVFVQSKDGNTVAGNPASLGGGTTDAHVIYEGLSRVAADAVLAGAETIRGSDLIFSVWRKELVDLRDTMRLSRHPIQIVATLRGLSFEDTLLLNVPELQVVVLTVAACVERMNEDFARRPWITLITMAQPQDLATAFRQLRAMGISRISAIGGRTVARALLDARLIQDLYLTTSARPGGKPGTPLADKPIEGRLIVRKHGTGPDEGVVFEHLSIG